MAADPGSDPNWPPAQVVHQIHDRYLVEVVEQLGLCPFARRAREQGRVHRPLWWTAERTPSGLECATRLLELAQTEPDAEIVLLTFVVDDDHAWADSEAFASFTPRVRGAYADLAGPGFFMVPFHPRFATDPDEHANKRRSPEALVPALRRSPDPVIQCVRADVLERVRAQAQQTAHERLRLRFREDPIMSALIAQSVQADPELSSDIARHNFEAVGTGPGRAELERTLQDIAAARDLAYRRP